MWLRRLARPSPSHLVLRTAPLLLAHTTSACAEQHNGVSVSGGDTFTGFDTGTPEKDRLHGIGPHQLAPLAQPESCL